MGELRQQIGVLQHTGAEERDRLDAELPEQALVHGFRWDAERQPASEDGVSSHTPASRLHPVWWPLSKRREYQLPVSMGVCSIYR